MRPLDRELIYQIFSKCFYYPDEQLATLLNDGILSDFLASVFPGSQKYSAELAKWLAKSPAADDLLSVLQVEYTHLFINSFPGVVAPIYSSYYSEKELFGRSTAEISDFYQRYNFDVATNLNEPADHLAIELEFVYRMAKDEQPLAAQIEFIRNHILNWIHPLAEKVNEAAERPFYPYVLAALTKFLEKETKSKRMGKISST